MTPKGIVGLNVVWNSGPAMDNCGGVDGECDACDQLKDNGAIRGTDIPRPMWVKSVDSGCFP